MTQSPDKNPFVYVGIASSVVALRKEDGSLAWSTRLRRSTQLVSVLHDGPRVFAIAGGEVSCLDARTGELLWHNELRGYGRSWAVLAGSSQDAAGASAATAAQAASTAAMVAAVTATTASAN
jgi:outer membrane protein assembly factor BamB